jgi:hypothetical protein
MWPYRTEVDLAIARPPTPENTVTVYGIVSAERDLEAHLTAIYMAMGFHPDTVMPVASRVTPIEVEEI